MTRKEIIKEAQEQVNCCTPLYPESFIQGYIAGAEPRENKIADIKANCDLAIEGRDIKIKELEDHLAEEVELHLHAEDYIKSLEKENKKLEGDFRICEKNADTYYDQLTKATEIIKRLKSLIEDVCDINYLSKNNTKLLKQAEQFLKEIEK